MSVYSTKQRQLLFSFFKNKPDGTFNASQIFESLEANEISLSAVYRNLTLLEKEQKIKKVNIENSREKFYQYIKHDDCVGKIHLHCDKCDSVFHMETALADHIVSDIENSVEFDINKKSTMLYGTCRDCKV